MQGAIALHVASVGHRVEAWLASGVRQGASFAQGRDLAHFTPSESAILTRSATDLAPIFFIR
jgi:hypothetical protein